MNHNDGILGIFSISLALHILLLSLCFFGFPHNSRKLPESDNIIAIEMLPVRDISNIKTQKIKKEKAIEAEAAKKVQKSEPKEASKEADKDSTKNLSTNKENKDTSKTQQNSDKAEIIKNKTQPKIKPKEEVKIAKKDDLDKNKATQKNKKVSAKNEKSTDLDALLKTLEQASDGKEAKSKKQSSSQGDTEAKENAKGNFNEDLPLSVSEELAFKKQIERHWNIPAGAQNLWDISVTLYIMLNRDGSLERVRIVNKECGQSSVSLCDAIADSALRAVQLASPLQELSENRYDAWKESNITFTPSDM